VFYRRPKSFHHAVTSYRKAYPDSTLVLLCDSGCYNYSSAAAALGAVYMGEPHRLSMKKFGAFYIGPEEAMNVIRAYRAALELITEPYYMQLEDDVHTLKRIDVKGLKGAINGLAFDKSIVGGAEAYVKRHVPSPPHMFLGGFGGCVYETAYWRRILNLPEIEAEIADMYAVADNYGIDYIMSTLLWRYGGVMHDWRGYIESFRPESKERIDKGEIEVLHGFKQFYGNSGDLSWEEKMLLGSYDRGIAA